MVVNQYAIYLVNLDPTRGSEMQKTRPCVVLTPDEMNKHINTVQIAPLTSTLRHYPWRTEVMLNGKSGKIALDHIRAIDKSRIIKKLGKLNDIEIRLLKNIIKEMLID